MTSRTTLILSHPSSSLLEGDDDLKQRCLPRISFKIKRDVPPPASTLAAPPPLKKARAEEPVAVAERPAVAPVVPARLEDLLARVGVSLDPPLVSCPGALLPRGDDGDAPLGCQFNMVGARCPSDAAAEDPSSSSSDAEVLWRRLRSALSQTDVDPASVRHLLVRRQDDMRAVVDASRALRAHEGLDAPAGRSDARAWGRPDTRRFALVRRLHAPAFRPVLEEDRRVRARRLPFSIAELLLSSAETREAAAEASAERAAELVAAWGTTDETDLEDAGRRRLLRSTTRAVVRHLVAALEQHSDARQSPSVRDAVARLLSQCRSEVKRRPSKKCSLLTKTFASLAKAMPVCVERLRRGDVGKGSSTSWKDESHASLTDSPIDVRSDLVAEHSDPLSTQPQQQQQQQPSHRTKGDSNIDASSSHDSSSTGLPTLNYAMSKEQKKIEELAKGVVAEYEQFKTAERTTPGIDQPRRSGRRKRQEDRGTDGSLIYDSHQMSRDQFVAHARLMERANDRFQRRFLPGRSRPTLRRLRFSSPAVVDEIRAVFFDPDGSLKRSVINDIDISVHNDPRRISFGQTITSTSRRDDRRWQVSVRKHTLGNHVPTRDVVEALFLREGVVEPGDEVHEIGVLIGGTEDQRLHHDVARQIAVWYEERPSTRHQQENETRPPLTGWEVDRLRYNEAMASPCAPSSLLIGLADDDGDGDGPAVLLGVQRDRAVPSRDGRYCRAVGGCGAEYEVVRSNGSLLVIKVPHGAVFTGDFPHCGVRNVEPGSERDRLMTDLNERVARIHAETPARERIARSQRMLTMMTRFPRLNELCRLHCSTAMVSGVFQQPANAVGFSDCWINERDGRCKEGDEATTTETETAEMLPPAKDLQQEQEQEQEVGVKEYDIEYKDEVDVNDPMSKEEEGTNGVDDESDHDDNDSDHVVEDDDDDSEEEY